MNLKNYTSTVSPMQSVARIEKCLVAIGASNISKTYDNGDLIGIVFQIQDDAYPCVFKLPANVKAVEEQFMAQVKRPRKGTLAMVKQQAERTAWKLLLDWVEVQMSLVQISRRKVIEVFLPYVYNFNTDQTFYERLEAGGFKQLASGK